MTKTPLVSTPELLAEVVSRAQARPAVAVDTEFVWERTYYPALGLIQIGLGGDDIHLIDTVALGDLSPLGALLEDEGTVKVLHDAVQDLQILARATASLPRQAFDTQRAAGFVGLASTLSLQDLIEWSSDVRLGKGETRTNWLQRPLSDKQIRYAQNDVRYLLDAYEELRHEAAERGRSDWLSEEMSRYDAPDLYTEADPSDALDRVKAKGVGRLSGRQRAVLRSVAAWREREARRLDRTRRMVLPDDVLVAVAERGPRSESDLRKLRLTDRQIDRYAEGLLAAVEEGVDAPAERVARRGRPGPEELRQAARRSVVQGFIAGSCERADIDPALVATKSVIGDIVDAGPEAVADALPGWRYEFVGRDLEALLRGDLAVRLDGEAGWPHGVAA